MKRNKYHKDYGDYFWGERVSGNLVLAVIIIVVAVIIEGVKWLIDRF